MADDYEILDVDFKLEKSKVEGEYSLKLTKDNISKYVLSKYEPRKKILKELEKLEYNRNSLFIIIGFGLGYVVEKINELAGEDVIIYIIEPSPLLLANQAEIIDKDKFKKALFFTGAEFEKFYENIFWDIKDCVINNIKIFVHPHYEYFYPQYIKRITDIIKTVKSDQVINTLTIHAIGTRYPDNCINNAYYINDSCDMQYHKDRYKDIPAVVVSAGPSLDKNLEQLKEFNGIIFCVGRTIQSVKNIGKEIDFTCTIDYSTKIYDTFAGNMDVPVIAMSSSAKEVINDWKNKIYFVEIAPAMVELIDLELPKVKIQGSVSTLCIERATFMGCNPIIMIGQDLAYTNKKSYSAMCNLYNEDDLLKMVDVNKSKVYKLTEGYYPGEEVITSDLLIGFRRWIQRHIMKNPNKLYINATEGGAKIIGAVQMPLKEVVKKYGHIHKPKIEHPLLLNTPININKKLENCIDKLQTKIDLANEAVLKAQEITNEYKNYKEKESLDKIKIWTKELEELDKNISTIEINNLSEYLFSLITTPIITSDEYKEQIHRSDIENAMALSQANVKMYEALEYSLIDLKQRIENKLKEQKNGK